MGELLSLLSGIFFSTSTMLAQKGMKSSTASAGVTVAIMTNNLVFWLIVLFIFRRGMLPPFNLEGVLFAAAGGVMGNLLGRTLTYLGVLRIGSARTTSLILSQTLFSLLLGWILLKESLSLSGVLGIVLVVLGIYWLSLERVKKEETAAASDRLRSATERRAKEGILLALFAGLAYSGADLLRKAGVNAMPSALLTSAVGGAAALVAQALVVTIQGGWKEIARLDRKTWHILMFSGVASGVAVITLNTALTYKPVAIVSALYSTRVWFVIAVGPILLGVEEKASGTLLGSTLAILSGVLMIMLG